MQYSYLALNSAQGVVLWVGMPAPAKSRNYKRMLDTRKLPDKSSPGRALLRTPAREGVQGAPLAMGAACGGDKCSMASRTQETRGQ